MSKQATPSKGVGEAREGNRPLGGTGAQRGAYEAPDQLPAATFGASRYGAMAIPYGWVPTLTAVEVVAPGSITAMVMSEEFVM